MEKGGPTILDQVGRNNPWAGEWFCLRGNCLPCKWRLLLAKEAEEETLRMAGFKEMEGEGKGNRKIVQRAEDKIALPSCTTEGVNYWLKCMECRSQGKRRLYYGETGRKSILERMRNLRDWRRSSVTPTSSPLLGRSCWQKTGGDEENNLYPLNSPW